MFAVWFVVFEAANGLDAAGDGALDGCPKGEAPCVGCEGFPNGLAAALFWLLLFDPNGLAVWFVVVLGAPKGFDEALLLLLAAAPKGLELLLVVLGAPKGLGFAPS